MRPPGTVHGAEVQPLEFAGRDRDPHLAEAKRGGQFLKPASSVLPLQQIMKGDLLRHDGHSSLRHIRPLRRRSRDEHQLALNMQSQTGHDVIDASSLKKIAEVVVLAPEDHHAVKLRIASDGRPLRDDVLRRESRPFRNRQHHLEAPDLRIVPVVRRLDEQRKPLHGSRPDLGSNAYPFHIRLQFIYQHMI